MADKAGTNTFDTLNGHFKKIYAKDIKDLRPDGVKLLNSIAFMGSDKATGDFYNQPVMLSHEHGFTYGGSAGAAFELNGARQSSHRNAQVRGTELVLQSFLSVAAASRSQNSAGAFVQETKLIVENMMKSTAKRIEVGILYGQSNIGVVESVSTQTIKIEDHEWASGIWSGAENMEISIFDPTGATLRGDGVITGVSFDNKEITIDNAVTAAALVAGDIIHFKSAVVAGPIYNEFAGIHKIISNTGSLFNINAASFNLWKGNIVNVGANFSGGEAVLSFDKIEEGIAKAMEKGLNDEPITVICSPKSWKNLLVEQDAKRLYDDSYKKELAEAGHSSICFYGPNGKIEVMASIYCKEGYAYGIPLKEFMRIGSSDITFEQPGYEGKFFRLLENHNGYELRAYTDQALFTSKPGLCILFQYIKS